MLTIKDFAGEGDAYAEILNKETKIASVKVSRPPFAVDIDSAAHGQAPIVFARNGSTTLMLRNDADVPIGVKWRITVDGLRYCGNPILTESWWRTLANLFRADRTASAPRCPDDDYTKWGPTVVVVPPRGRQVLDVHPPGDWYPREFSGVFKDEVLDATLSLAWMESDLASDPTPARKDVASGRTSVRKDLPFKAQLRYYTPLQQYGWSTLYIFVALFLGGAASLAARNWVPNQLRKSDLKDRLREVSIQVSGISSHVESSLRVHMRVESRRLVEVLDSRPTLSPDMAGVFAQCETGLTILARRIDHVNVIDSLIERLAAIRTTAPPSVVDDAETLLRKASQMLRHARPLEQDFQTVQSLIGQARTVLDGVPVTDEKFGESLARRFTGLKPFAAAPAPGAADTVAGLRAALPGVFAIVADDRFADGTKIPTGSYAWLDLNLAILTLLRDYTRLHDGSTDPNFRKLLDDNEPALVAALSFQSYDRFQKARSLLRQMREGIFVSDVRAAIEAKQFSIEVDPAVPKVWQSFRLSVRFHCAELNASSASEQFVCLWEFRDVVPGTAAAPTAPRGDELERGWNVSHYFVDSKEREVSVYFEDPEGKRLGAAGTASLTRSVTPDTDVVAGAKDRLFMELIGLVIVLLIALLGLISGAREQVLKLDILPGLISVFLLGFGADTVKGLLTQRPGS